MKNILVTGVAGFIGSNLYKYLLNKNYKIKELDELCVWKLNSIYKKKLNFIGLKLKI